jgi:CBS domain containing-hemolysin-like protein
MLFAIIASLALIGFFSGYEIGFVSANRLSLELKKKQGGRSGKIIAKFLAHTIYWHLLSRFKYFIGCIWYFV